jgi:hypothetical protein
MLKKKNEDCSSKISEEEIEIGFKSMHQLNVKKRTLNILYNTPLG